MIDWVLIMPLVHACPQNNFIKFEHYNKITEKFREVELI